MEQKKILWIVVIVSVFVLLIFGAALLLYAPSRSTGPTLLPAAAVTQPVPTTGTAGSDKTSSGIDPDSWVREPEKTPGLDSTPPTPNGNINLTIVNGDNAGATYGTLDVSGLTQTPPPQEIQPAPTQDTPDAATTDDTATQTTIKPAKPATPPPATAIKPTKTAKPAPVKTAPAKTAVKEAPKKTVAVTEYWIQTGSFSSKINAEKARETFTARYLSAEIFTKGVKGATTFRVRVGPYRTKDEAEYWLGTVKEIAGFSGSFISEVKTKK
jgi:cell division septation protein DedD